MDTGLGAQENPAAVEHLVAGVGGDEPLLLISTSRVTWPWGPTCAASTIGSEVAVPVISSTLNT